MMLTRETQQNDNVLGSLWNNSGAQPLPKEGVEGEECGVPKGPEPFWMRDIRRAQRAIDSKRLALRKEREGRHKKKSRVVI
jgi:hypothetical protein